MRQRTDLKMAQIKLKIGSIIIECEQCNDLNTNPCFPFIASRLQRSIKKEFNVMHRDKLVKLHRKPRNNIYIKQNTGTQLFESGYRLSGLASCEMENRL